MVIFHSYVKLPEGNLISNLRLNVDPGLINPGWLIVVVPPNSDFDGYWNGTPPIFNSRKRGLFIRGWHYGKIPLISRLVVSIIFYFPFHRKGMSSETHWRTPLFFKMGTLHHQPVIDFPLSSLWVPEISEGLPNFRPRFSSPFVRLLHRSSSGQVKQVPNHQMMRNP